MGVVFDLGEVACALANINNAKEKMLNVISGGQAYEVFEKMVYEHGGDINNINCNYTDNINIKAVESGKLQFINTKKIGEAVNFINLLNGNKDNNSGSEFFKKNNDKINRGDVILRLFSNNRNNLRIAEKLAYESFTIN